MDEKRLKFLKGNRSILRGKCTRLINKLVPEYIDSLEKRDCNNFIDDLSELRRKLDSKNSEVLNLIWNSDSLEVDDDEYTKSEEYDEKLLSSLKILRNKVFDLEEAASSSAVGNIASSSGGSTQLKLPQVPLPEYSHAEGENLEQFFSNLENILDKHTLTQYEKYVLLERQLKGEALLLVRSLSGDNQSYDDAKTLLLKAFASPVIQKFEILSKLSSLNLSYNGSPYVFISEMRLILNSIKTLKISMEDVAQYFIWNGMPFLLQSQLINITNNNRPSVNEIEDHIFSAVERFQALQKRNPTHKVSLNSSSKPQNVGNYAANVVNTSNDKFKPCAFCSKEKTADHSMSRCQKYATASEKLAMIRKLKLCQSCGNEHSTESCKFKFYRACYHCNGTHFSFLCPKSPNKESANFTKIEKVKVANAMINIETTMVNFQSNFSTILPTCSLPIAKEKYLHTLIDSGAQCSLILAEVAEKMKFKVLEGVDIQINGINSTKPYKTKIVEIPVFIHDNRSFIRAICVPEINIRLKILGLNDLIGQFNKRGYGLADKTFLERKELDCIEGIEFILGADFSQLIGENKKVFPNHTCNCVHSSLGVILMGTVQSIRDNILKYSPGDKKCAAGIAIHSGPVASGVSKQVQVAHGGGSRGCRGRRSGDDAGIDDSLPNDDGLAACNNCEGDHNIPRDCDARLEGEVGPPLPACNFHQGMPSNNLKLPDLAVELEPGKPKFSSAKIKTCDLNPLKKSDKFINDEIENLAKDALEEQCSLLLNYERGFVDEHSDPVEQRSIEKVLNLIDRDESGRIIVPILWNEQNSHRLGQNLNLSKNILFSNFKKLEFDSDKLAMIDDVFQEQLSLNIIDKIDNLDTFVSENPNCSFLAHMPIFKMDKETSKCRNVFLSNLKEKGGNKLSHNQTINPGVNLNRKLSTAIIQVRFDKYLLVYDLVKAFLQLKISDEDSKKLCFLWFNDIKNGDKRIIGFRMNRVPFGLRCSPSLLLLSLYYLLIIDDTSTNCPKFIDFKKQLYHCLYMDNGAYTSNCPEQVSWACNSLEKVYQPFGFETQQILTNNIALQDEIDKQTDTVAPVKVNLLGLEWDRSNDKLSCKNLSLDREACTKRTILKSIASNFDIFNINMPLLNRARLFMHMLQTKTKLGWDCRLSKEHLAEWRNIANQFNSQEKLVLDRFVGARSDKYMLIGFSDSSKSIYGLVIYLYNLTSKTMHFLLAKNRIVNKQQETKTIPVLEFQALTFGAEILLETYNELRDDRNVIPVTITELHLFTDSSTCLSWLKENFCSYDKMNKKSVYLKNRIDRIGQICEKKSISFSFCSGNTNPADHVTRAISFKQLSKTNFISGLDPKKLWDPSLPKVTVPSVPMAVQANAYQIDGPLAPPKSLCPIDRFSKFSKVFNVNFYALKFINKLKSKVNERGIVKFEIFSESQLRDLAQQILIKNDQFEHYKDILSYFYKGFNVPLKDVPELVKRLNIFLDQNGILRVKAKFKRWTADNIDFPILLAKSSDLTNLIITDYHKTLAHAGIYSILSELRKRFFVPHCFSVIKRILKNCVVCKRVNSRPVKLNQSTYRNFRADPPTIPYRSIFIDFIGPLYVRENGSKTKKYLLCISCLWSRSVNLKICKDLSLPSLLRALQLQVMEHGMPSQIFSDSGSQLTAASEYLNRILNEEECKNYLVQNGIKSFDFQHYPKGCNKLGGIVESCVKMTKRLIYGSIRNNVLDAESFEFLIQTVIHLINRRPVAFRESLRDGSIGQELPMAITPEILVRGYELVSINIVPPLLSDSDSSDPDFTILGSGQGIREGLEKLKKCRSYLVEIYQNEFLSNLMDNSTDQRGRYSKVNSCNIVPGDIVLLKEPMIKPNYFPMAIVKSISLNDLDEVTMVTLLKGSTGETVTRHVNSIIHLLSSRDITVSNSTKMPSKNAQKSRSSSRRKAAVKSRKKTADSYLRGEL